MEKCKEAYATWIKMAHAVLKQKKVENQACLWGKKLSEEAATREELASENEEEQRVEIVVGGGIVSILREALANVTSYVKRQSGTRHALVLTFVVTIVVLLGRGPEQVVEVGNNNKQDEYSGGGESVAWLEKRMHFLREEIMMVEDRSQRMRQHHASLKAAFHQLERLLLRHQR